MKKVLIILFSVLLALALILAGGAYMMFQKELGVIGTIEKINDDAKLYTMKYVGDSGFDEFIANGGAGSSDELADFLMGFISKGFYRPNVNENEGGCSSIAVKSANGEYLFGRNFDWTDCTAMIVETSPPNGYRSVSTVNLDFLGYNDEYQPDSISRSFLALSAPFVPLDGMNEKGLCVADLIIEDAGETHQDTGKPALTTTTAIRLILDYAATVDEAISLLEQYDMHSDIHSMHHLAIADASGRSVVVEYIDDVMFVTDAPVVTNFFLTQGEMYGIGSERSKARYNVLADAYSKNGGVMDEFNVKSVLESVRSTNDFEPQWISQWSVVFNQTTGAVNYYRHENFEKTYVFQVK